MQPLRRRLRAEHAFRARHRRHRELRPGAVSAVVLSATFLAAIGAAEHKSTRDAPAALMARPAIVAAPALPSMVVPSPAPDRVEAVQVVPSPVPPSPSRVPAPTKVVFVPGLDRQQQANAAVIVRQGRRQGLPDQALVVAIATALQESNLYNVANSAVPESLACPHQGVSIDHDSVGLFQQRVGQGWGSVPELMDPVRAAMLFFNSLVRVVGWQSMTVTAAAQAVQRSAFPLAYEKRVPQAQQVVQALR